MKKKLSKMFSRTISYLTFAYGVFVCNLCLAGEAKDPLYDSVRPQVEALFGPGSTVAYCIYVAEIILGSVLYIKNKNPLTLVGVPIIVIFTSAMFKYIGG